ncbi:unnamed protein product [Hyaloperonospora brassicae]|uniref:Transmembrane protein n=1 Tax=Hyaloperonospora brassicae TaxID=162125 RepID=A0AAV0T8M0_HYABA|nr:unnamed protein product [Hyaloperonospora brassicae]
MPAVPSDAGLGSKEEDDAQLNERISKAHSELSELHRKIITDKSDRGSDGPARRTRSRTTRPLPLDVDYGTSSERPLQQRPSTNDPMRSDRMRLAELSNEQQLQGMRSAEKDATAVPSALRRTQAPRRPVDRINMATLPPPLAAAANDLRDCSTDIGQPALPLDDVTDTDDEALVTPARTDASRRTKTRDNRRVLDDTVAVRYCDEPLGARRAGGADGGSRTHAELHTYVRQMEETIAQLVQQKDELVQNQTEFDKHASGIFPSLEHLNQQLTQLVQGKLLHSGQSRTSDTDHDDHDHNDVATLHDDMLDELRVQREQLSELEADSKRRKYDAELQEQSRAIEISRIRADVISVVANGKMRDERTELVSDSLKKVQQELQEAVKSMVQRYQLLDKRVSQLQVAVQPPQVTTEGRKTRWNTLRFFVTMLLLGTMSAAVGFLVVSSRECGVIERCRPLI